MVIRIWFITALLLGITGLCNAQGRFRGGQGGGDASLTLTIPGGVSKIYTYPNPARVGEPVHVFGAEGKEIKVSKVIGEISVNNELVFIVPGIYLLKLNTIWLKQVVY